MRNVFHDEEPLRGGVVDGKRKEVPNRPFDDDHPVPIRFLRVFHAITAKSLVVTRKVLVHARHELHRDLSRQSELADGGATQSRMNKAILCGHRYPSIADESVQQLRLKLQVNEG
jgi:hypothetical protein